MDAVAYLSLGLIRFLKNVKLLLRRSPLFILDTIRRALVTAEVFVKMSSKWSLTMSELLMALSRILIWVVCEINWSRILMLSHFEVWCIFWCWTCRCKMQRKSAAQANSWLTFKWRLLAENSLVSPDEIMGNSSANWRIAVEFSAIACNLDLYKLNKTALKHWLRPFWKSVW